MKNWHHRHINWYIALVLLQFFINLFWLLLPPFDLFGEPAVPLLLNTESAERWAIFTAWGLYNLLSLLTILILAGPLVYFEQKRGAQTAAHAVSVLFSIVLAINFFWVMFPALYSPSLFTDSLFKDGPGKTWSLPIALAQWGGPGLLWGGLALFAVALGLRLRPQRTFCFLLFFYYSALALFLFSWPGKTDLQLPARSLVLFFSDSLRADHVNESSMSGLSKMIRDHGATALLNVIPTSTRTSVALGSFFTGKLPAEHGILSMFGKPATLNTPETYISSLKSSGYCTMAIAEYPGEFLHRNDFGFEYVDAPLLNWHTILKQIFLKKDPFLLATLSHYKIRKFIPALLRSPFESLLTYSDPALLIRRFQEKTALCGERPIFAFLFSGITHMPYVQRWPFYSQRPLAGEPQILGRYSWIRTDTPEKLRLADQRLYSNAVAAFDSAAAAFVKKWFPRNSESTLVFSSDHGEYLHDDVEFSGHGDRLGPLGGLTVPWIVFGARKEEFNFTGETPIASIAIAQTLFKNLPASESEKNIAYTETEIWMEAGAAPVDRIPYPAPPELFDLELPSNFIVIKEAYRQLVEAAKTRAWFFGGSRLELRPGLQTTGIFLDGREIDTSHFPTHLPAPLKFTVLAHLQSIESVRKTLNAH